MAKNSPTQTEEPVMETEAVGANGGSPKTEEVAHG
jgi:hypothetical protein